MSELEHTKKIYQERILLFLTINSKLYFSLKMQPVQQPDYFGFYRDVMYPNEDLKASRKHADVQARLAALAGQKGYSTADATDYMKKGRALYNEALGKKKAGRTEWSNLNTEEHKKRKNSVSLEFAENTKKYVGDKYPQGLHSKKYDTWLGKYPQTLAPSDREEAARTFAEMTGTLGWMPTYDRKLASKKSARVVYPDISKYDIQAYDMDNNPLTPENVIIHMKNKDGTLGPMIAANGYKLPNATPSQQFRRLKEIDYYENNPTIDNRKQTKYGVFLQKNFYSKPSSSVMSSVKQFIKDLLSREMAWTLKAPVYFSFNYVNPTTNVLTVVNDLCFRAQQVAFNTIISRTARLFLLYNVYSLAPQIQNANTMETLSFNKYISVLQAGPHPDEYGEICLDQRIYWWMDKLLDPDVEAAMLKDSRIAAIVESFISTYNQKYAQDMSDAMHGESVVYHRIRGLMNLVILFTMNYSSSALTKLVGAPNKSTLREKAYFNMAMGQTYDLMISGIGAGNIDPIDISVISNTQLQKMGLKYVGREYEIPKGQPVFTQPAASASAGNNDNNEEWGESEVLNGGSSSSSSAASGN